MTNRAIKEPVNPMRVVRTKDYELIARLNKDVHDVHYRLYPDIFKAYDYNVMKAFFQEKAENPDVIFLVLEEEQQQYAGYAWIDIRIIPESIVRKPSRSIYIHQLSINQEARGKGYGRMLMQHIEEIAKNMQISCIELDYWADNDRAAAFYEKNGFRRSRVFVSKEIRR